MQLSLPTDELKSFVLAQLDHFYPDGHSASAMGGVILTAHLILPLSDWNIALII